MGKATQNQEPTQDQTNDQDQPEVKKTGGKTKAKEVKMVTLIYHKSNVVSFQLDKTQPLFRIMAGTNHIPSDIFELMKKDSILNGKIESGLIEVISDDSTGDSPAEIYKSLKPKAKRDIITNEVSAENLNSYAEIEKNSELQKLIEERIAIVGAETQYRS